jgi:hypothetical protein
MPPSGCGQAQSDGEAAQLRTNVLVGVTAALGAATAASLLFVRWHDGAPTVSVGPRQVTLHGEF